MFDPATHFGVVKTMDDLRYPELWRPSAAGLLSFWSTGLDWLRGRSLGHKMPALRVATLYHGMCGLTVRGLKGERAP